MDVHVTRVALFAAANGNVGLASNSLGSLGTRHELRAWIARGAYPRGVGPTQQAKPLWQGAPSKENKDAAAQLKREAQTVLANATKAGDDLLSELRAKYRAVDAAHAAALWSRVRELFDYPVFVAAPKAVGITSTGDTGEGVTNDLSSVLAGFKEFANWIASGAATTTQPEFEQ